MSTRRVVTHKQCNFDNEELLVLVCYEEGINKQVIKKENPYCKTYETLVKDGQTYAFIKKNA